MYCQTEQYNNPNKAIFSLFFKNQIFKNSYTHTFVAQGGKDNLFKIYSISKVDPLFLDLILKMENTF